MHLHARFLDLILSQLAAMQAAGELPAGLDTGAVTAEPPRDPSHGDIATNAAMVLTKQAGRPPREIAAALAARLAALDDIEAAEVAGPGFINLRLARGVWEAELASILTAGHDYGRGAARPESRINVEYVSTNPTGPVHVGHCRGAVVGDALASLLAFAGHEVTREYYINDAGGQVDVLARSVHLRYREALGEAVSVPEGYYPGDYLIPIGEALATEHGDRFVDAPEAEWLPMFRALTVERMMARIREDLASLGIHQDVFFSEASLGSRVQEALDALDARGLIHQGVLERPKGTSTEDWEPRPQTLFRSTEFGDDSDRAMKKSDGSWTYFAGDVAYHYDKIQRGYTALVNVFGADHAGYVKRVTAAVKALSDGRVPLDIKVIQIVKLMKNGAPFKMSKRAGNFVTLRDIVDEVGKDVVRFIMLTKRPESPLDFDFAKAVEQTRENPVFYVQYAHARIASLGRKVAEAGMALPAADLSLLCDDELAVLKLAAGFPRLIEQAADAREPHRIAFYLAELAAGFHSLWNAGNDDAARRFVRPDDAALTAARLALAQAVGQVIRNALAVIGVDAADELH
ncbi:MAG: arginine--tRNA ligase [Polymorphobacter sp.]|uniref:arginine--tRNA ligase n=1 Tax=Polymorphobacter sp. TaxID=1909290 RepID=UPI003A883FAE